MPPIPQDDDGPVFREPWEAQAFAIVLHLYDAGHLTWNEWVETLSAEIASVKAAGDPDLGDRYYHLWLAALETIATAKGLTDVAELAAREGRLGRGRPPPRLRRADRPRRPRPRPRARSWPRPRPRWRPPQPLTRVPP
jgi:nitrile hydratase accessory protein